MSADERELARMLDLYRAARTPDPAVHSRVWTTVEANMGSAPALPEHEPVAPGTAAVSSAGAKWLALATVIALGVGISWFASSGDEAPAFLGGASSDNAQAAKAALPEPARARADDPGPEPTPDTAADAAARTAAPAVQRRGEGPRAPAADPGSSLAQELKLLASAQAAAQGRRHDRSLVLLRRHAQRFPQGALSEEREVALVDTLCALGRKADAAAVAIRFVTRFPGSPRSSRVREACVEVAP